ncbi:MAG: hypothetical protein U0790_07265 [Isosphaeraceae bacterium]
MRHDSGTTPGRPDAPSLVPRSDVLNTSILGDLDRLHRFRDGRFYGWEGVGCRGDVHPRLALRPGGRALFPSWSVILRERVDYADGSASIRGPA